MEPDFIEIKYVDHDIDKEHWRSIRVRSMFLPSVGDLIVPEGGEVVRVAKVSHCIRRDQGDPSTPWLIPVVAVVSRDEDEDDDRPPRFLS